MKQLLPLLLFLLSLPLQAQSKAKPEAKYKKVEKTYRYRVSLADKKQSPYSLKHPEAFLSAKALERRKKFRIRVDRRDLPVSPTYVSQLRATSNGIHCMSKWNNTVVVNVSSTADSARLAALPFVTKVQRVWNGPDSIRIEVPSTETLPEMYPTRFSNKRDTTLASPYGFGKNQVEMLGVEKLHQQQFTGKGVTIAVIDGGFCNADRIEALKDAKILSTRNFVRPKKSVYRELDHGMNVLGCIAANKPHLLVGTAPDATFHLLVSEDGDSEQLVEEDNWAAAVEYADSVGADMVTSSLGYYHFDHPDMNHKYAELDGHTALISHTASLAASRGIVLLNSAGNEGDNRWKKIGFPGDATDILTVGAVDYKRRNTFFSSLGNSADGRVKPDVMAQGGASATLHTDGCVRFANGTSFSCPIMCGAVACLLQASPKSKPQEIIRAVQQSGDNCSTPDNIFGYGIPSMPRALEILKNGK